VDVLGDSVGWTLVHYLPSTPGFKFVDRTEMGCGVVRGGPYRYFGQEFQARKICDTWPSRWSREIRADHPDEILLVVGRWETMDRIYRGAWTHVGAAGFDRYLTQSLGQAIDRLGSTGARVIIANEPYNRRGEQPNGQLYPEDTPARVDSWNAIVTQVVARHPGTTLLNLNRKLCPRGRFTWTVHGVTVRSDGVHLTPQGVQWLTPWLVSRLRHA
jgi:hypothetical protein